MANMKEAQMAKEELLDNIQKFVLCGRAMLDALEQIAIQSAVYKVQSAKEASEEAPAETAPVKQLESIIKDRLVHHLVREAQILFLCPEVDVSAVLLSHAPRFGCGI